MAADPYANLANLTVIHQPSPSCHKLFLSVCKDACEGEGCSGGATFFFFFTSLPIPKKTLHISCLKIYVILYALTIEQS